MPIGVSSAPYAKFTKAGDRFGGEIVDVRIVQTVDFDSKRPQYLQQDPDTGVWSRVFSAYAPDGKPNDPIVQYEITVDTGIEDKDGDTELRIFVDPRKGRRNTLLEGKRGGDAIATALKKVKAHRVGLEIGGSFFLVMGEKVRDGSGPLTNTWSAEYQPPAGGLGTGRPVDEVPRLVGGARYDKAAELEKWEKSQLPALQQTLAVPAPAKTAAATTPHAEASATNGIRDTNVATASASSYDDEPPF